MSKKRASEDKSAKKSSKTEKLENKLVENMVELQKLHVNLIEKFDGLAEQVTHLLALFETSAKTFAKSPAIEMASKDHEFLQKIDKLLEQNKVLAKGLTLMEQKLRERMYGSSGTENVAGF
ncbi:hypothetical protein CO038_01620 [Candidatus Pacearchaeota archaeon CG_4_9_14_0_2_um_filter_39_13]|nr:hypothetical protein [Candidatus Pacearchaeota archaeon]OIO42456.1 MAG: hypothetical protein AUJ64_04060 [Candidatus Pacearchaeota archaeon CG1_02_39_14]PJC44829.1 MAG: hypothetical protein CO038_01620 [Candidatus Pacearchaeota archaeon CG_4_9_14_0_2_um_filter_39_13]